MNAQALSEISSARSSALSENLLSNLPHSAHISHESRTGSPPRIDSISVRANQAGLVISKIEDIFESMTDCLLENGKEFTIRLKTRRKSGMQAHDTDNGTIRSLPNSKTRAITFPSKNSKEAWKFTVLLRILELSHEALVAGDVITKRDMYYRDPGLFLKQDVVDRYVDDIAYTFDVRRESLNVVAAAKGLITGSFSVCDNHGSTTDYTQVSEGLLIPAVNNIQTMDLQHVRWILVIEKEATFHTLAMNHYWKQSTAGNGILITAKGYPDIRTRQFLCLLSMEHPTIPILALVDFDPDGIGIMSTYKYGSIALAHENKTLTAPGIRWLGIGSYDIAHEESSKVGLLKLTSRDRRIATRMLGKETFSEEGMEMEWRRELQVMLLMNLKAEIQILGNGEELESWLNGKLSQCLS
ncbi:hypothetical protein B7494_g4466 [Chlorociboria aeruginascens]|nr:hypothetical protein B7494_g4466 [Chlorociboria aeruginascens]